MPSAEDLIARLRVENRARFQADMGAAASSVKDVGQAGGQAAAGLDRADRSSRKARGGFVSLRASTRGVYAGLGSVVRGSAGLAAGAAGIYGLGNAFQFAFKEADESARVSAQTAAVLKSTGAAAGLTANQVGNLANEISGYAGIDDEAIQSAENLLLTFTRVRNEAGKGNDIFNQATKAATDLGVAMGTDTRSAALMLGKALQDPAKGFTRLQRSGVSFTASQAKQIKALIASGNLLGAQQIILREVTREFGGSAAAQAQPIDKLRVAWGNLAEAAGRALLPAIAAVTGVLTRVILDIQNGTGAAGAFVRTLRDGAMFVYQHRDALLALAGGVTAAVLAYRAFGIIQSVIGAVRLGIGIYKAWRAGTIGVTAAQWLLNSALIANPIGLVIAAIAGLAAGLVIAYKRSETFRNIVNGAFAAVKSAAQSVVAAVQLIIDKVQEAVAAIANSPLGKVAGAVGAAAGAAGSVIGGAADVLGFRATGGPVNRSGNYVLHEQGPEIVRLPGGSFVYPSGVAPAPALGGRGDIMIRLTPELSGRVLYDEVVRIAGADLARGGGG